MTDYGLATGETWDFGENQIWRYLIITKATPKMITYKLSNGTHILGENYGNSEFKRKLFTDPHNGLWLPPKFGLNTRFFHRAEKIVSAN
tara:strand:+ start:935 stop:1201 length:267 start_codon:yes stop_codon:yes gene_type:complete